MSGYTSRRSVYRARVAYADTDRASVVHHAAYFRFLELARVEFWREGGLDYRRFEETTGLGLPVVEANVRYRAPARFDDAIEVTTTVERASRASVWHVATIAREGALLVEARVRLACVSLAEGQLRKIPDAVLDACLLPGWQI